MDISASTFDDMIKLIYSDRVNYKFVLYMIINIFIPMIVRLDNKNIAVLIY